MRRALALATYLLITEAAWAVTSEEKLSAAVGLVVRCYLERAKVELSEWPDSQ